LLDKLDNVGNQITEKLQPIFRLIHSGILAISAVSLIQFAPTASSIGFPLNLSVYCFALCTPLAAMQAVILTAEKNALEAIRTRLSYKVHVVLAAVTILSFYAGTLYMCAYFSLPTSAVFALASSVAYALLMYTLVPEDNRGYYVMLFCGALALYSGIILFAAYLAYDLLAAYEPSRN